MKKFYFLFILIAMFGMLNNSQSQISSKPLNGLTLWFPWRAFDIDVNSDGTYDFTMRSFRRDTIPKEHVIYITTFNYSQILTDSVSGHTLAKCLNLGDAINESLTNWKTPQSPVHFDLVHWDSLGNFYGLWLNQISKYLGVRFNKNGDWYYGWIEVSVTSDTAHGAANYVPECAYNIYPGPITAGQTTSGIQSNFSRSDIYSCGKKLICELGNENHGHISIFNACGQSVLQMQLNNHYTELSLFNQPSGVYFVNITSDHRNYNTKLFIK